MDRILFSAYHSPVNDHYPDLLLTHRINHCNKYITFT